MLLVNKLDLLGEGQVRDTLAALQGHLEQVAWHRANVAQAANPELEFT